MAITRFTQVLDDKAAFERMLQRVCDRHGIARADFLQAEMTDYGNRLALAFKPARYDIGLVRLANAVHDRLNDEFVGEVTRAAAPELSKDAAELTNAILNPERRIIYVDEKAFKNL